MKKSLVPNIIVCILIVLLVIGIVLIIKTSSINNIYSQNNNYNSLYTINGNGINEFDLQFLLLENDKKNKVYSPLSIKYVLEMLADGANGDTKAQILGLLGSYSFNKYKDSKNMAFANALFVKDGYKQKIKQEYISNISFKYGASVIYDSFMSAKLLNNWVNKKTLGLIKNILSDDQIENLDYILVNSLGIDMAWSDDTLQPYNDWHPIDYYHENYKDFWDGIINDGFNPIDFDNINKKVYSAKVNAVANKYDIISELGEDYIKNLVSEEYEKYLMTKNGEGSDPLDVYIKTYMDEIKSNYKKFDKNSNFSFYVDDDTKVFAKDLKTYDNITLQYIGIMPINESLDSYITSINANKISKLINSLKKAEYDSFEEGYVTSVSGYIPFFNFDYQLNLKDDLIKLGIKDVFDIEKVDLSNLTSEKSVIVDAFHKSMIEFTNDGIKASSVTAAMGIGGVDMGFDYLFDVPVKKIDITFNKPYLFLIRDISTNEIWFVGTVYNPTTLRPQSK